MTNKAPIAAVSEIPAIYKNTQHCPLLGVLFFAWV
jgi:hypothetical protein